MCILVKHPDDGRKRDRNMQVNINDMIYLTAIGLPPGGSSTVHIYTQTIHRTTQSTQTIPRTTQFTNLKE